LKDIPKKEFILKEKKGHEKHDPFNFLAL